MAALWSRSNDSSSSQISTDEDLIDYIPTSHIKVVEKEISILNRIKREGQLQEYSVHEIGAKYVHEFMHNKQILFCIVTPGTRQIPHHEFCFTFNLYIPSWKPVQRLRRHIGQHHGRRRSSSSANQYEAYKRIFLGHRFTANYENLYRIRHTIEHKMRTSGHYYFARKPYPKPKEETIDKRRKYGKMNEKSTTYELRSHSPSVQNPKDLHEEMQCEQKYYKLPDLPSGRPRDSWWRKRTGSTQKDLIEYAEFLHIIFNSASLCIQDLVYDELKFDRDIIGVLKQKAQSKLDALLSLAEQVHLNTIDDPKVLISRKYRTSYKLQHHPHARSSRQSVSNSHAYGHDQRALPRRSSDEQRQYHHRAKALNLTDLSFLQNLDYRYHTVYIVSRPLNFNIGNIAGFNHWALKFEGINHLLTVGFFYDESTKESKINCNILRNSKMNRRIFWYWWPRRFIEDTDPHDPQFFNANWEVIDSIFLGTMSTECIGRLIRRWLTKYGLYVMATNNCQHFVRDMVTVMDLKVARKLPAFFDTKILGMIPAAAAAGIIAEEARMMEVADMLSREIADYKRCVEVRRQEQQRKMLERYQQNDESDNDDTGDEYDANWAKVADFLGISGDEEEEEEEDSDDDGNGGNGGRYESKDVVEEEPEDENDREDAVEETKVKMLACIERARHGRNDDEEIVNAVRALMRYHCDLKEIQQAFLKANMRMPKEVYKLALEDEWYGEQQEKEYTMKHMESLTQIYDEHKDDDSQFVQHCCTLLHEMELVDVVQFLLTQNRSLQDVERSLMEIHMKLPPEVYLLKSAWKWLTTAADVDMNANIRDDDLNSTESKDDEKQEMEKDEMVNTKHSRQMSTVKEQENWNMLIAGIEQNCPVQDRYSVFKALRKLAQNLLLEDEKYRVLYTDNQIVEQKILSRVGGYEFLRAIGFKQGAEKNALICKKVNKDIVNTAIHTLSAKIAHLQRTRNET